MVYRQLFFIDSRLVAEVGRGLRFVHTALVPPDSGLFYCQYCGEVYAKTPVIKEDGTTSQWVSHRGWCSKCAPHCFSMLDAIPGSVWLSWDEAYIAALPVEVVRRELLLHLDHFERLNS